jgi:hypothetical protein
MLRLENPYSRIENPDIQILIPKPTLLTFAY